MNRRVGPFSFEPLLCFGLVNANVRHYESFEGLTIEHWRSPLSSKLNSVGAPPRISPDGTRVALDVRDQENDIWIWGLNRDTSPG